MTISAVSVEIRGTRRIRTAFSGPLASGAFTTLSLYSITATDGGINPINVVAVFAIASSPSAVEFAVDSDLSSGALYQVGYTAVPGADSSFFTGTTLARIALELTDQPNVEPETQDLDLLLYGRDLQFKNDFLQDASGDLLSSTGRKNWLGAMTRRFGSDGLGWDPSYGPQAEAAVEGPQALAPSFAGALVAQARLDDRNKQASVTVDQAPNDPAGFVFNITLIGRDGLSTQTISVAQ